MRRYLILFLLLIFLKLSFSQNLIPDGSFEDTLNLWELRQMGGTLSEGLPNWYDAVDGFGDYFNIELGKQNLLYGATQNGIPNFGVPSNIFTELRWPRTGIGYAGSNFFVNREGQDDTCKETEVIGVKLKQKLVINRCYKIILYVGATFYRSSYAIDALDVKFTNEPLSFCQNVWEYGDTITKFCRCKITPDTNSIETYYPQLSSPSGIYFTDDVGWQKLEFEYIADGTEKYFQFGLLRGNLCDSINYIIMPQTINSIYKTSAYLFFDDISVYPCDAPEYPADIGIKDTCIIIGSPIVLGGLPKEEYLYWWYDSHDSLISRQSSITVYPTQDTSFVLVQKDFKFDETRDSIHIKVGNCTTIPDYSGYDFSIYPNPNYGDFQVRFNTAVPEGAVLELYDLLGRKLAEYPLSGSGNIANINGIEVASAIYYATVVVPNVFRKSVKMVIMK